MLGLGRLDRGCVHAVSVEKARSDGVVGEGDEATGKRWVEKGEGVVALEGWENEETVSEPGADRSFITSLITRRIEIGVTPSVLFATP